jgi:hypothetical protein
MSQATAVRTSARHATRPVPKPVPQPPRLRVVSAPAAARSRAGAVVGCALLLVAGLVSLLLVQTDLTRGAYTLQETQKQARVLAEQEQSLREELEKLQAPQNLAAAAGRLGMVPAPNPAFLRASDGKVLGVPAPGVAIPSPTVKKVAAKPSADARSTKASAKKKGTPEPDKATTKKKAAKKPAPSATSTGAPGEDG